LLESLDVVLRPTFVMDVIALLRLLNDVQTVFVLTPFVRKIPLLAVLLVV
jgi:hypothetical protein